MTRHLDAFGEEYLIVDTKRILLGDHLTYWSKGNKSDVLYRGEAIGPVKSVWYQDLSFERMGESRAFAQLIREQGTQAGILGLEKLYHDLLGDTDSQYWSAALPVESMMKEYARNGLNRLATALGNMYPEAFWISRRSAVVRAMHKPLQLKLAQEAGFIVPETIVTSDPREAAAFLQRLGTCVMKPLSISPPAGQNQYTTILDVTEPPDFSGLFVSPHIFQELVTPLRELRVTGMGALTFAATVEDTDAESETRVGVRDWRAGFEKGTFKASRYELSRSTRRKHVKLLREFGLVNGMTDIIINGRGEEVYLETNPNGAFGFIEDETEYPLGFTQARLLSSAGRWVASQRWVRQYV